MEFESVQQAAERLGVTVRAVQKWAKEGKLPGAEKVGRDWRIPKGAATDAEVAPAPAVDTFRIAMPLLNSSFLPGECMEYIRSIADADDRNIALGEYYYFSGQPEKAIEMVEPYLDSPVAALQYSAALLCSFSNLSLGSIHLSRFALGVLNERLYDELGSKDPRVYAVGIFTATAASVLLHMPVPETPPLEDYMRYLPGGVKLWSCYLLAHKAYLAGNYERAVAIAETGLTVCPAHYPIAEIYVHLVAVMALMSLMRTEEAKVHFRVAWMLAKADDFIEPFGEHHGLLHGMVEVYFKNDHPADYKRIIDITYKFSAGWRKIHNADTNDGVTDDLTTMEFTIAMLYNRGWTVKEIAAHMELSDRTVKKHLSVIYEKLGISNRKELGQFMLR